MSWAPVERVVTYGVSPDIAPLFVQITRSLAVDNVYRPNPRLNPRYSPLADAILVTGYLARLRANG